MPATLRSTLRRCGLAPAGQAGQALGAGLHPVTPRTDPGEVEQVVGAAVGHGADVINLGRWFDVAEVAERVPGEDLATGGVGEFRPVGCP